ncbi:SDR family NAD(P)-dependent oxidoreductase [Obesumbacterium proteus]|uniref:SDR family NAD(P)-dependent oxidoreductase n=1 Tax=Obesumbacterium proteus TaxID=82983 RepID=UPI00242CF92E|nr:SDR family oxidoreductase [Obesumbacterium proteus]
MNNTVVISGGTKGLGLSLTKKFICQGYNVATFSRNINDDVLSLSDSSKFYWENIDILDHEKLEIYVKRVVDKFGGIDLLINNAGFLYEGLLSFTYDWVIDKTIDVNIKGPIVLTKLCSKYMIKNNGGTILNISSINATRGHKGVSAYSASKAALNGFTCSLARELGPCNIRVNSFSPGFFDSDLVSYLSEERKKQILKRTPLGRLGTIDDMTEMVMFLCSEKASFITGQNIIVDGGMTC